MTFAEHILAPLAHLRSRLIAPRMDIAHDGVLQKKSKVPPPQLASALGAALTIPCPDPTAEERTRDAFQMRGQKLARNEDWDLLTTEIAKADTAREKTLGGTPIAELLAYGARADVVATAEHALMTGCPAPDAPLLAGIEALEQVLAEHPGNTILAAIVAQAHIDIGWAWRGTGWDLDLPTRNRDAFSAHFDRAADIVHEHDADNTDSPLLAATVCALSAGRGGPLRPIIAHYERWIELDPKNARTHRAFGVQLLPRWHGDYDRLELEARRTAGRTHDIWGAGGYTWVMFDAISCDPEACARVDLDFFLDGLRDILHCAPDQHTVNLLASYCANTMGAAQTGMDEVDYMRHQIATAAVWIVRDHLKELHPMLWAHAARGFDNALRVRCADKFAAAGYADALRFLTDMFRREIAAGKTVVFTKNGPETRAA